ncbi:MAG: hypothetical protein KGQ46_02205 [Hyphomicrobiales bacterium]|nr:hypothetical protein [Hyphomicrobiales bacterium]MDE2114760.1 hypothetical protein [Hyphomicrobiales bacterium]
MNQAGVIVEKRKAPVFTEAQRRPEISNPLDQDIGIGFVFVNPTTPFAKHGSRIEP